ncbi:Galectin-8 [Camelus dromedarius]|uniref:Galectin n=1 Tax=Camelus dromedarius TaxID=9838 RepID=A0A5N4DJI8_CAMDR|nr:Galectin-8 [Camelus dromedarius]
MMAPVILDFAPSPVELKQRDTDLSAPEEGTLLRSSSCLQGSQRPRPRQFTMTGALSKHWLCLALILLGIPYVGTISEPLEPGTSIVLRGHVPGDSDRFQVDLQCGSSVKPRADVAFHFNPRFKRANCIVCNTLRNEKWGWEEITYDMPFKKEESFEIVIMVLKEKFQVAVNGRHILLYAHRIPLDKVDTLGIRGQVTIRSVGFCFSPVPKSDMPQFPSNRGGGISKVVPRTVYTKSKGSTASHTLTCAKILPTNCLSKGVLAFKRCLVCLDRLPARPRSAGFLVLTVVSSQTLPYVAKLNSSMGPGRTVVIKGEVNTCAKGFNVNLRSAKSRAIALHLNPRLNSKAFVRNSFLQESWGEEERNITCFPFSPGMYFEMIIYCDVRDFKVAVNGAHSLEYKHRFKELGDVDTLEVDGDIRLLEVRSW